MRSRVSTKWATIAVTIRSTKLNGAPKTDPAPTKSQSGDSTSLDAILTE